MPQLDKISITSTLFWFLIAYFSFYFLNVYIILPGVLRNLKYRNLKLSFLEANVKGLGNMNVGVENKQVILWSLASFLVVEKLYFLKFQSTLIKVFKFHVWFLMLLYTNFVNIPLKSLTSLYILNSFFKDKFSSINFIKNWLIEFFNKNVKKFSFLGLGLYFKNISKGYDLNTFYNQNVLYLFIKQCLRLDITKI